jgi:hypothetical protein
LPPPAAEEISHHGRCPVVVDISFVVKGNQKTRVEDDHLATSHSVDDCIDLLAQAVVAFEVGFRT